MTLTVGDLELEFPDGSAGNATFKWTGVTVDWEDGEVIKVSIAAHCRGRRTSPRPTLPPPASPP